MYFICHTSLIHVICQHSLLEIPHLSYQSTRQKEPDSPDVQLERPLHSNLIQVHEYTDCACLIWKARNSFSAYAGAGNRGEPRGAQHSFCLHQWFFLFCTHMRFYPGPSLFFPDSRNWTLALWVWSLTTQPHLGWSSNVCEFGNLAQIDLWREQVVKRIFVPLISAGMRNHAVGRWSCLPAIPQPLNSPPEMAL